MPAGDQRRSARLVVAAAALVLGTGLMVTEAAAVLSGGAVAPATVELGDDDNGRARFSVENMAPGRPVVGCVAVTYRSDGHSGLRLHAAGQGTGLDAALRLVVEAGTGGGFDDCTGFSGAGLYDGTLAGFTDLHHDFESGLAVEAVPGDEPVAFRFTAEVLDDNTAQGREAMATFTWEAREVAVPVTTTTVPPPPSPGADPQPAPVVEPVPGTDPAPAVEPRSAPATSETPLPEASPEAPSPGAIDLSGPVAPTTPETSSPTPAPAPASEPEAAPTAPDSATGRRMLTPLGGGGQRPFGEALLHGVAVVAQKAAFPGVLLLLAGLFVLGQDRIDRRDPKLALAPLYPDPDLHFDRPLRTGRES